MLFTSIIFHKVKSFGDKELHRQQEKACGMQAFILIIRKEYYKNAIGTRRESKAVKSCSGIANPFWSCINASL